MSEEQSQPEEAVGDPLMGFMNTPAWQRSAMVQAQINQGRMN